MLLKRLKELPLTIYANSFHIFLNYPLCGQGVTSAPQRATCRAKRLRSNLTLTSRYCEVHQKAVDAHYNKYERDPATRKRYGKSWKRIRDRGISQRIRYIGWST